MVISTPNNTHFPFAKQAIQAGKHVLIEKPMCITSAEGQELVQLSEENGVVLSVYQNRRWDSDFLTLKQVISSGKVRLHPVFSPAPLKLSPLDRRARVKDEVE